MGALRNRPRHSYCEPKVFLEKVADEALKIPCFELHPTECRVHKKWSWLSASNTSVRQALPTEVRAGCAALHEHQVVVDGKQMCHLGFDLHVLKCDVVG